LGELPADIYADVEGLPFRDYSFDLIFCLHAMEFTSDWRRGVREVFRTLRPHGMLILGENYIYGMAAAIELNPQRLLGGTPRRTFGEDLPSYLRKTGFSVEPYDYLSRNNACGDWFFLCVKTTRAGEDIDVESVKKED
jgi:SAM-dependent methyltransferase